MHRQSSDHPHRTDLHTKIAFTAGAAMAIDPPVLQGQKDTPQIFSPKDAQDQKEGRVSKTGPETLQLQLQMHLTF